jgi:hypothetical protein
MEDGLIVSLNDPLVFIHARAHNHSQPTKDYMLETFIKGAINSQLQKLLVNYTPSVSLG